MPNNRFKNSEVAFCIIHFKNQKSLIIIFTLIGIPNFKNTGDTAPESNHLLHELFKDFSIRD